MPSELPRLIIKRSITKEILEHALTNAKKYGVEVIGWLVGFFGDNAIYVLKSYPCTKYIRQGRYEAEADPKEEARITMKFPRNIGVVGIYHSHPFRDYSHTQKCDDLLFHSSTDSRTLHTRTGRLKNYLSIVTDGVSLTCYVPVGQDVQIAEPLLVENLNLQDHLLKYTLKAKFRFVGNIHGDLENGFPLYVENYMNALEEYINRTETEINVLSTSVEKIITVPPINGSERIKDNKITIIAGDMGSTLETEMSYSPTIFVHKNADKKNVTQALKNELLDETFTLLYSANTKKAKKNINEGTRTLSWQICV